MSESEAYFLPRGEQFEPTELAQSPWTPDALHGGPVAGLLALAIERHRPDDDVLLARLTVDLFRAVPRRALAVASRPLRSGRRIQVVEAALLDGDTEVAHATGVLLRRSGETTTVEREATTPPPRGPEGIPTASLMGRSTPPPWPGFHTTIEVRRISGTPGSGQGAAWVRVPYPLIAGEAMTPVVRAATTSDIANGIGHVRADEANVGFINVDITLQLHREPRGEWLALDVSAGVEPRGLGTNAATLYDPDGAAGRVFETLLANPRDPRMPGPGS